MLKALPRIRDRIYGDFLMESRLALYGQLLEIGTASGLPDLFRRGGLATHREWRTAPVPAPHDPPS